MLRWLWTSSFVIVTGVIGLGYAWMLHRQRENQIPTQWKRIGIIENLIIYPMKSGSSIELKDADCTELGLREVGSEKKYVLRDRCFVIYQARDQQVLSVKKSKRLSKTLLISIQVVDENVLLFRAPDHEDFELKLSSVITSPRCVKIYLYGGEFETADCGDEVAKWLSQYLTGSDDSHRLGCYVDNFVAKPNPREVRAKTKNVLLLTYKHWRNIDSGLYADLTSYLIVNAASVDHVNNKLPPEDRFSYANMRPNIVVRGEREYGEDDWKWIKLGDSVVMRTVKPCTRCRMITINQNTAEHNENLQPLKILRTYRTVKHIKGIDVEGDLVTFGVNTGLYVPGQIKVGDPVYVNI